MNEESRRSFSLIFITTVVKKKLTLPGLAEIFPTGRRPFVKVSGLDYGSNYEPLEATFQVRYYSIL